MKIDFFKDPSNEEWDEWFGFMVSSANHYPTGKKRWVLSLVFFKYCLNIEL